MFSTLGQIFSSQPLTRRPESTDAHLFIRKQESEGRKNSNNNSTEQGEDNQQMPDADYATVSVKALRLFLLNYLKQDDELETSAAQTMRSNDNDIRKSSKNKMQDYGGGYAAHAAGRYAHAAKTAENWPSMYKGRTPEKSLSYDDISLINCALDDLKFLADKGIEFITVTKADSFLQSIAQSVVEARSKLQEGHDP